MQHLRTVASRRASISAAVSYAELKRDAFLQRRL